MGPWQRVTPLPSLSLSPAHPWLTLRPPPVSLLTDKMAPAQFENTKNRLAAQLRHLTQKLVKPVVSMLKNKKQFKMADIQQQQQQEKMWMHPADLKLSEAEAENAANEALEAKLRELIVTEYASRGRALRNPMSLRIQGHLTIIPSLILPPCWAPSGR